MTRGKRKDGLNFEASLKKLEAIVQRLEDEEAPLEESLRLFAEGKELARLCQSELQEAENRVRLLIENEKGELKETPLDEEAESGDGEDEAEKEVSAEETPSHSAAPPAAARPRDELPF